VSDDDETLAEAAREIAAEHERERT